MCTAISYNAKNHYFGRNLDFEKGFGELIVITTRNKPFPFRKSPEITTHYAMIGMAVVDNNYPLYFDATNEQGLSMAGLYFPDHAVYQPEADNMHNITPFEFIPWILSQCSNINETLCILSSTNLINLAYSEAMPLTPLHWIICDKDRSIVVEPTKEGLKVYENPFGILTNNPPFPYHLYNVTNYLNLTSDEPTNRIAPQCNLSPYSRGMGGIGLPGDLSSSSRFVRAVFNKFNSRCDDTEDSAVNQFFHILRSVEQQEGCVKIGNEYEKTIYSSCCNTESGIYYYTTYNNSQITAISMKNEDLNGNKLVLFPVANNAQIRYEN